MTETESALFEFIVNEKLKGDNSGLALDTPLLSLNILDSFGIMVVLAFIENDLGVMIAPEDFDKESFGTIGNIAALVDSQKA